MSHPGKIAELQAAKQAGYHIIVLLVATNYPDINVQRVRIRVAARGHDVPEDRIRARYTRTLALAPAAITLADQAFVFDNTQRRNRPWFEPAGRVERRTPDSNA